MDQGSPRIDKAEPRWQAVLAFVAVAGIYLALPSSLIVGPTWLLPTLIGVLLVPTVISHRIGSCSFLFPQMQIPKDERGQFECTRWRPQFVDYLFVAFTQSSTFGPTDAPLLARWAKGLAMAQGFISLFIVVLLISRAVGAL